MIICMPIKYNEYVFRETYGCVFYSQYCLNKALNLPILLQEHPLNLSKFNQITFPLYISSIEMFIYLNSKSLKIEIKKTQKNKWTKKPTKTWKKTKQKKQQQNNTRSMKRNVIKTKTNQMKITYCWT